MASNLYIPKINKSAYKHYWSAALNELKHESIVAFDLWKAAGKPSIGPLYEGKNHAKYKYKLAIRDAAKLAEEDFSNDLYDVLCDKDYKQFWKTWKNKTKGSPTNIGSVCGSMIPQEIANKFADHFKQSFVSKMSAAGSVGVVDDESFNNDPHEIQKWMFSEDDVYKAINALQFGKAAGADGIFPEHIKHAHATLTIHLKCLFNLMLCHGYVPRSFGAGVIIPILKDK